MFQLHHFAEEPEDRDAGVGREPVTWEQIHQTLREARSYWIMAPVRSAPPIVVSVRGVWVGGRFFFETGARWHKSLRHLPGSTLWAVARAGSEAIVLEGSACRVRDDVSLSAFALAYAGKYENRRDGDGSVLPRDVYTLRVRATYSFGGDDVAQGATRWRLIDR